MEAWGTGPDAPFTPLVIDFSTIEPSRTRQLADRLAERGIEVKAASSEEVPLEPPVDFAGEFLAPFAGKVAAAEKTEGGQAVTEKQ